MSSLQSNETAPYNQTYLPQAIGQFLVRRYEARGAIGNPEHPDGGEPARLVPLDLPPHLGDVALRLPPQRDEKLDPGLEELLAVA